MMDIAFWLFMLGLAALLWWASFYATKRMRIEKNRMREEQARRNLEARAASPSEGDGPQTSKEE